MRRFNLEQLIIVLFLLGSLYSGFTVLSQVKSIHTSQVNLNK